MLAHFGTLIAERLGTPKEIRLTEHQVKDAAAVLSRRDTLTRIARLVASSRPYDKTEWALYGTGRNATTTIPVTRLEIAAFLDLLLEKASDELRSLGVDIR